MDNMKHRRLQELDRSDFEITKGEPDIRGWDVRNAEGQKIGEVEELIIDAQQKKVRYMVVELDDDEIDLEDDKKVLLPIGLAELDQDDDDVLLPSVTVEHLRSLPAYDRDHLDDDVERRICDTLGRSSYTGNVAANPAVSAPSSTGTAPHTERQESHTQTVQPTGQTEQTGSTDRHTGDTHHQSSNTTTGTNDQQQPQLGTAEYYGNFYQHQFFSDESLYRRRMQEAKKESEQRTDPEYERGLRLWEMRSEGGIIPGDSNPDAGRDREISDDRRQEMIRDRRKAYEERRGPRKSSIIQRIKDEGMQDAKH